MTNVNYGFKVRLKIVRNIALIQSHMHESITIIIGGHERIIIINDRFILLLFYTLRIEVDCSVFNISSTKQHYFESKVLLPSKRHIFRNFKNCGYFLLRG